MIDWIHSTTPAEGTFEDAFGTRCAIRQNHALRLLVMGPELAVPDMQLNQKQVAELIPHLQRFAETGEL